MSSVDSLVEQLACTSVDDNKTEKIVSFVGMGLQLNTEADAAEIVKAIQDCPGMTTMRLEGNTVGIPAAKAISKALETQPNFRKALWKDMFTGRDKTEIPQALSHLSDGIIVSNASLAVLDLSDNAFGPRGLVGLQKLLESPACFTLQELHLNNNGLGISGAQLLSESLCKCIEKSRKLGTPLQLKIFVCGRNRLENPGAELVAKFLKQIGTLESVAMPQNGIYPPGIEALSDAFIANPNLKVINLEDNSLTEDGAHRIAMCFPSLPALEMLNLGDCLIRTDGALSIASFLKNSCPDIVDINLGFNEISLAGGTTIVNALENKEKLQSLNLNGNCFGDVGCEALVLRMKVAGVSERMKSGEVLQSLSEDEGDNYLEDDDYYDDEEEEEDGDEENSPKEVKPAGLEDNGTCESLHPSPMSRMDLVNFISRPTAESLISLHKSNADFFTVLPENPTIKDCTELFFIISSVVTLDEENIKAAAIKYADDLLSKGYSLASKHVSEFNNELLVSIGLMKGEDKKPKSGVDVTGVFVVLSHAVKQPYFHASTRDLMQFFLSKPLQYVTTHSKAKHLLMQTLYQM